MSNAFALVLPRVRRLKRPPARLVFTSLMCAASLVWTFAVWMLILRGLGLPMLVKAGALVIGLLNVAGYYVCLVVQVWAWRRGRVLSRVSRREWGLLVANVVAAAFLLAEGLQ